MIKEAHVMLREEIEAWFIREVRELQKKLNTLSFSFAFNESVEDGRQIILHKNSE